MLQGRNKALLPLLVCFVVAERWITTDPPNNDHNTRSRGKERREEERAQSRSGCLGLASWYPPSTTKYRGAIYSPTSFFALLHIVSLWFSNKTVAQEQAGSWRVRSQSSTTLVISSVKDTMVLLLVGGDPRTCSRALVEERRKALIKASMCTMQ